MNGARQAGELEADRTSEVRDTHSGNYLPYCRHAHSLNTGVA
jgi:hypothetical protein